MTIFILGATGLLGQSVVAELAKSDMEYVPVSRDTIPNLPNRLRDPESMLLELGAKKGDYIFNAIGVTRHRITAGQTTLSAETVHHINAQLPHLIGRYAENSNCTAVQIGTDCVFSGSRGNYVETDVTDAVDEYGASKAEGESASGVNIIRASFVGPSKLGTPYLWDWVRNQPTGAILQGFTNVIWNGVTASIHAKVIIGAMREGYVTSPLQHFVPGNSVSKADLLRLIAKAADRTDLRIIDSEAAEQKNMSLSTIDRSTNQDLWELASYHSVPDIEEMIMAESGSM